MGYTNSPLVVYTKLSPNHSGQRTHSIDRITPHCVVGQLSAESICGCFTSTDRQASCNYGIGPDGRVALCVEEKNRSWCSSSRENDQRAITIECASDAKEPYAMTDAVYAALIKLCADICKRYGKAKLLWLGDKDRTLNYAPKADEMVLTVHRWFANKSCPGTWLYQRMGNLADKVTAELGGVVSVPEEKAPVPAETPSMKLGDLVSITGTTYYNGKEIPGWVRRLKWYVHDVSGDRVVINRDESGRFSIMSPVKVSCVSLVGSQPATEVDRTYTVVKGDSLWEIAKNQLGSGNRYKEIISLNGLKSNLIYSGMKLKLPQK